MSRKNPPYIRTKQHYPDNALQLLFKGSGYVEPDAIKVVEKYLGHTTEWKKIQKKTDKLLSKWDKYLKIASEELWIATSYYTGNTRGSIKLVGKNYFEYNIEFDKEEWFRPKTLYNIRTKTINATWKVKSGTHSKTYRYRPGSVAVKINGKDYSERIPLPPHSGKIDTLIETYEAMKEDAFRKAGFHVK